MARVGVFIAGALGDVATTVVAGAAAIARGLAPPTGLATALSDFAGARLAALADLVFGGCDIREGNLRETASALERGQVLPAGLAAAVRDALDDASARIAPGILLGASPAVEAMAAGGRAAARRLSPREAVAAAREAILSFRERAAAERLVVVHLASVEPRNEEAERLPDERVLERFLDAAGERCPASLVYALAAQDAGAAYVNFTPCCGASAPALRARAERLGLVHAGRDGKTGETLLKSVLAPLFHARNLRVLSWAGYNILGNRDGAALADPAAKDAKLRTKGSVLRAILGDGLGTEHVDIEYVPSIGDWKTAWDHVHFEGFLGCRMSLELTWRGCDSALAAPLVLDLIRLVDRAACTGRRGLLPELAAFFKDPLGTGEARFSAQLEMLKAFAASLRAASAT